MGKQSKARRTDSVGKGKVTPVQIAFIVDRYLHDNNYKQSRSAFRAEASSLIAKSPLHEAPEGLLSLGAMLNEYISLKEQKVTVDQERVRLEQERVRLEQETWKIQTLLRGMQDAMNAYNAHAALPPTAEILPQNTKFVAAKPPSAPTSVSPAGCATYNTPTMPSSIAAKVSRGSEKSSLQLSDQPSSCKRKGPGTSMEATSTGKKTRRVSSSSKTPCKSSQIVRQSNEGSNSQDGKISSAMQTSTQKSVISGSSIQGSSIVKRLFNQPLPSTPKKSSCPITPPQGISTRSDKSVNSSETSSFATCSNNTPQAVTPTHCTVVSYEKVTVSPYKQFASYTIERSRCISSTSPAKTDSMRLNKRDHVKGRLDFDNSDAPISLDGEGAENPSNSPTESNIDIFDIDFPNLDAFGEDFSFSELLVDLDLGYDGIDHASQPTSDASPETISESPDSRDNTLHCHQCLSESPANVMETFSENDMNCPGINDIKMESVTKYTSILSPAKSPGSSVEQENCALED